MFTVILYIIMTFSVIYEYMSMTTENKLSKYIYLRVFRLSFIVSKYLTSYFGVDIIHDYYTKY